MSSRIERKEQLQALQNYTEDVSCILDKRGRKKLSKWLRNEVINNPSARLLMASYFEDDYTPEKAATELLNAIKRDKYTITDW